MPSIRLDVVRDTARLIEIDLVDEDGVPLPLCDLAGATAEFFVRVAATDVSNILYFVTPDVGHFVFKTGHAALVLNLAPIDTRTLALQVYTFMVKLTYADGEPFDVIEWSPFDLNLGGTAAPTPPVFTNTVKVNHDFGLADALRYLTSGGSPIANAQVRLYLKSTYDAGDLSAPVGVTLTDAAGRWVTPILVTTGFSYTIQFLKPNEYGPDVATITA